MIKVYTPPQDEFKLERFFSEDGLEPNIPYKVYIDGKEVSLFAARVSAMPVNTWWPGRQRPLYQTEVTAFVSLESDCNVEMKIVPQKSFDKVNVRPTSKNVDFSVEDGCITVNFTEKGQYTVEPFGTKSALHVFINPIENHKKEESNTIYFGPGVHNVGLIELKSNQTVYIDSGAVVYGHIHAIDADNIKIIGRGILDTSTLKEDPSKALDPELFNDIVHEVERTGTIVLEYCTNVYIEGITIRDPLFLCLRPVACKDVHIDNIKIIGCWRYNSDGIDFINSEHCLVENSFVRTFDDSLNIKGFYFLNQGMMFHNRKIHAVARDIFFKNCVVWNQWAHALEVGTDLCASEICNCGFIDCDVIHACETVIDVSNSDYAEVYNISFKNINVEYDEIFPRPTYHADINEVIYPEYDREFLPRLISIEIRYLKEVSCSGLYRGFVHDIVLENIRIFSEKIPPIIIEGYDDKHKIKDVTIKDIYLNDKKIKPNKIEPITNEFVERTTII